MKIVRNEIVVILDRSGSMYSVANDTEGGFNSFVAEQKEVPGNAWLTLAQFDTEYELVHDRVPIHSVPELNFHPRGGTALLDAVGRTIASTQEKIEKLDDSPDNIICVIITDGYENSSREFKKEQIKSMIKKAENENGWRFVYLGANQDAFSEAGGMGIDTLGTMAYTSNPEGTRNIYKSISKGVTNYRHTMSCAPDDVSLDSIKAKLDASDFFDEEDRKKNS